MDPLFNNASWLKKKGIPSLTLLAGILMGAAFFSWYAKMSKTLEIAEAARPVSQRGALTSDEENTINVFEEAASSVVFITTKRRTYDFFRNVMEQPAGTGSGFVWDQKGHIVTNYHVLQGGNAFEVVLLDQSIHEAKVIGLYPDKDMAILKIEADPKLLRPIPLGSSSDLKVGQKVLAIGNPFGLDHSLSTGVVSALDRTIESVNGREIEEVIQTDAAINPGNSGGPLLDSAGRLIGVNTQILSRSGASAGIGFAIPVDAVRRAAPQLIRFGEVKRAGMGISIGASTSIQRMLWRRGIKGVLIMYVQPRSGADKAGLRGTHRRGRKLQLGDILVDIEGEAIATPQDLYRVLDRFEIGTEVNVTFLRNGEKQKTKVTLEAISSR
ncbi:Trypsin-like peptidase domain-containing protein [Sulfidibacter corallicola]|uniref:Trypsin-like peptidase domain-containing protein n=1 Tax=Sulfidibacter corallicola TaxID=2818388 RepID=A0A8A4TSP1_SULCO|nr:trypsin-like peptidase domain-containing protein [Sulfidibacter corallicola]QTD52174.1 trypsin-like peptidase domain-containing protein [Sulfidibacter corallicola]